jgi:heavy metal sensor kinase
MMWPRSIGGRLTLWYAAAFAAALLALGGAMRAPCRKTCITRSTKGCAIEQKESASSRTTRRLDQEEVREEFRAHGDFFQVFDSNGHAIHRAETFGGAVAPPAVALETGPRFANADMHGTPLRIFSQAISIDDKLYEIQVAAPLADLQQGLRDALWLMVPMFPLMLALASAGGYFMSRRALAPVDRITQTARSITAENLSARLPLSRTGDELERLSATLNEMIGRLEAAFKRVSRFTADASHELRTPLAVMRTTAEVALRNADDGREHRIALEQVVAEIERTSNLVENLLLIAKADAGRADFSKRSIDVVAAVDEACSQAAVLAQVKGIDLTKRLPDRSISVPADPDALRRLFLNLLDNAVKYTPSGGKVEVALEQSDGHVSGVVRDTGIGIPSDDLPHIFDRFYRVDRARSRAQGGAGLGLAIARWIAEAHGGTLSVESEVERGSEFRVRLPLR